MRGAGDAHQPLGHLARPAEAGEAVTHRGVQLRIDRCVGLGEREHARPTSAGVFGSTQNTGVSG